MVAFKLIVLFVNDLAKSKRFYQQLLHTDPRDLSPTFAWFPLESGAQLELWQRDHVEPSSSAPAGAVELVIPMTDAESLQQLFQEWEAQDVSFAQRPTTMVFGPTFVAVDPDGHRLRVVVEPKRPL